MSERKCLMTFYPTDCKENCYNCKCGGVEATKDMYVSIHNVERVCTITGNAADTDEGEHIAEVIRNNLESMVISAKLIITPGDAKLVKCGQWITYNWHEGIFDGWGIQCDQCLERYKYGLRKKNFCPNCGARMDGDTE